MIEMIGVGSRVEVPAWTQEWKRGDRFGVVVARPMEGGRNSCLGTYFVKRDKSGQVTGYGVDSLRLVSSGS